MRAYTVLCCTVVMLNLKVTLTTVAEFYNEDNNTINHHGFKRKVGIEEEKVIRFARDFSHNKFALLWGEALLCLPFVCL